MLAVSRITRNWWSDGLSTSVFTLGNEACKFKSKTKIFGLIVDNACSFKDHTELVVARCKNKWRDLRIPCTSRWGLSRNTLTTLYKTLILPTLLYCAPVWSNQNAAKLQTFQSFVNRTILQTRFNPNESAAEVILGTPPIDNVCQNISAKFLTKVLQQRDLLSELFITSRERPKSAPYLRLKNIKRTSKCQAFSSTVPV